jgi:hypothetical protein
MTPEVFSLTPTELLGLASNALTRGGYQPVGEGFPDWKTASTRLFEDAYGVVGVAVFSTFADLLGSWTTLQGSLVAAISERVGRSESKAWDGYLVLLTMGMPPLADTEIEAIRYDTSRLRKLVATGDNLREPGDVDRILRPLLPLSPHNEVTSDSSALDLLPVLLAAKNIPLETTKILVDAFAGHRPLVEVLHRDG